MTIKKEKNKRRIRDRNNKYRAENIDKNRIWKKKCGDLKKDADFAYTVDDADITKEIFDYMCVNCGSKDNIHIDHHLPLSKGNGLNLMNAVLLCKSCNSSKQDKLPYDYYDIDTLIEIEDLLIVAGQDWEDNPLKKEVK